MNTLRHSVLVALCLALGACGKQEPSQSPGSAAESEAAPSATVTAEDVKEKSVEALDTAKQFTAQQKEEAEEALQAKLDEWRSKVNDLSERAKSAGQASRAEIEEKLSQLRKKMDDAQEKLAALKGAGEDAWQDLKSDLEDAVDDVQEFYRDAKTIVVSDAEQAEGGN